MKKQLHLLAAIFAFCTLCFACTQTTPAAGTTAVDNAQIVYKYQIPADTALYAQALWERVSAGVNKSFKSPADSLLYAKYIINGFRVHRDDLLGILQATDGSRARTTTPNDSIWCMLSVRPDTTYVNNQIVVKSKTSLIFETTNKSTGKRVYYDFSKPCPPNCPPIDTTKPGGGGK